MARTSLLSAAALLGFALTSAPAAACEAHAQPAPPAAPAAAKPAPAKPAPKAATRAREGSLLQEVDDVLAGKCSCSSAADCTCKKGSCHCPKCGGARRSLRMVDALKGTARPLENPESARYDARAGVFL